MLVPCTLLGTCHVKATGSKFRWSLLDCAEQRQPLTPPRPTGTKQPATEPASGPGSGLCHLSLPQTKWALTQPCGSTPCAAFPSQLLRAFAAALPQPCMVAFGEVPMAWQRRGSVQQPSTVTPCAAHSPTSHLSRSGAAPPSAARPCCAVAHRSGPDHRRQGPESGPGTRSGCGWRRLGRRNPSQGGRSDAPGARHAPHSRRPALPPRLSRAPRAETFWLAPPV